MTHYREIAGLRWAFPSSAPSITQRAEARPTAAQTSGLRYQAKVVKSVRDGARTWEIQVKSGPWFKYVDSTGVGYCQPDLLLLTPDHIWIVEIKLTYTPQAETQLTDLYMPVLARADRNNRTISGVIVCKNLTPAVAETRLTELGQILLTKYRPKTIPVVHWLGRGPILRAASTQGVAA